MVRPIDPHSARQRRLAKRAERQRKLFADHGVMPGQKRRKNQLTIPSGFADLIRGIARERRMTRADHPELNPFVIRHHAIHPPGVVPDKEVQMAMDSSLNWASGNWQTGGFLGSVFAEGQAFPGYPYLAELAQRPEYRAFSEIISTEMTRKWIKFSGKGEAHRQRKKEREMAEDFGLPDPYPDEREEDEKPETPEKQEKIAQLEEFLDNIHARDAYRMLETNDGLFGRSHLFHEIGGNDGSTPDGREELQSDIGIGVGDLSRSKVSPQLPLTNLQPIEPVWTYPTTYNAINPLQRSWYNPQVWYTMGMPIHCSRLFTQIGRPVPDLLKPAYSFGGISLSQLAQPYVDIWLQTRESVGRLVHAFSTMVLKTDLQAMMQPGGGAIMERANLFNVMRDNNQLFLLNKNTEDFSNVSAPLSGLHELQAQAQEHLCSVSRIPTAIYTGISPTGLNASSEGEIRIFENTIHAFQEARFRRNLTMTVNFAQLSLWGEVDPDIVFDFVPLRELTEKEEAELRKIDAETDDILVNGCNALSPEEVRQRVAGDENGPHAGINPDDMPEPPQPPPGEGGEGGPPQLPGGEKPGGRINTTGREAYTGAGAEQREEPVGDEIANDNDGASPTILRGAAILREMAVDAEWNESDHPRAPDGKFGSGGAGSFKGEKLEKSRNKLGMRGEIWEGNEGSEHAREWAKESVAKRLTTLFDPKRDGDPIVYHGVKPGHDRAGFTFVTRSHGGAKYHGDVQAFRIRPGAPIHADLEISDEKTGRETLLEPPEEDSSGIIHFTDLVPVHKPVGDDVGDPGPAGGTFASLAETDPNAALHPGYQPGPMRGVNPADPKKKHLTGDAEWKESDHPRAPDGKFGSGGGGGGGAAEKPTSEAPKGTAGLFAGLGEKWKKEPLDPAKLKKVGEKLGSNEGGTYENDKGHKFYIKKGKSAAHVASEKLAGKLFRLAGGRTLKYEDAGPDYIATRWEKMDKNNIDQFNKDERAQARADFARHAWIANWDATGTGNDNYSSKGGQALPNDLGGALEWRAQGSPKGDAFGDTVDEWDTMRDPSKNKWNADLFKGMSKDELRRSALPVALVPDRDIKAAVQRAGKPPEMAEKLIARKRDLEQRANGDPNVKENPVTFDLGGELPVSMLNGIPFKAWEPPPDWKDVDGTIEDLEGDDEMNLDPEGTGTPKRAATGIFMVEPDGRVWLMRPANRFGGYDQTIPKGGMEKGLTYQQNAIKEVWEETGLKANITGIVGDVEGDTSVTRYYFGDRAGGDPTDHEWEASAVVLAPPKIINEYLNRSRDREVAKYVLDNMGEDAALAGDAWNEGDHPRDEGGKFAPKGSGSFGKKAKAAKAGTAAKVVSAAVWASASEWASQKGMTTEEKLREWGYVPEEIEKGKKQADADKAKKIKDTLVGGWGSPTTKGAVGSMKSINAEFAAATAGLSDAEVLDLLHGESEKPVGTAVVAPSQIEEMKKAFGDYPPMTEATIASQKKHDPDFAVAAAGLSDAEVLALLNPSGSLEWPSKARSEPIPPTSAFFNGWKDSENAQQTIQALKEASAEYHPPTTINAVIAMKDMVPKFAAAAEGLSDQQVLDLLQQRPKEKAKKAKPGSKLAIVGELLKKGATAKEVLAATGWPSVSMPAQAKALGLDLVKVKDGKTFKYYGKPKGEAAMASLAEPEKPKERSPGEVKNLTSLKSSDGSTVEVFKAYGTGNIYLTTKNPKGTQVGPPQKFKPGQEAEALAFAKKIAGPQAEPDKPTENPNAPHAMYTSPDGDITVKLFKVPATGGINMVMIDNATGKPVGGIEKYKATEIAKAHQDAKSLTNGGGGKQAQSETPPAKTEPEKPKGPAPQASEEDLKKAKKATGFYAPQGIPPSMEGKVGEFNKKYQGKELTDPAALNEKVAEYKALKKEYDSELEKNAVQMAAAQKEKEAAAYAHKQAEAAQKQKASYEHKEQQFASKGNGFAAVAQIYGDDKAAHWAKNVKSKAQSLGVTLTDGEAAAIGGYTDGLYSQLNTALRMHTMTPAQHSAFIAGNSGLAKLPSYTKTTRRGTTLSVAEQAYYEVGQVVQEHGFASSGKGEGWGGNTKFHITGVSGKDVSSLSVSGPNEGGGEVLWPAKLWFKVTKKEKKGDVTHIHLEEALG